jgi:hypothetical protein
VRVGVDRGKPAAVGLVQEMSQLLGLSVAVRSCNGGGLPLIERSGELGCFSYDMKKSSVEVSLLHLLAPDFRGVVGCRASVGSLDDGLEDWLQAVDLQRHSWVCVLTAGTVPLGGFPALASSDQLVGYRSECFCSWSLAPKCPSLPFQ